MNERHIAIDVSQRTDTEIFQLVRAAHATIYSGKGAKPLFGKWLDMSGADCLRCVLGAPESWFGYERMRFFEVVFMHQFGIPLAPAPGIWRVDANWQPANLRRSNAPIDQSTLDLEFMDRFGLPDRGWESNVFHSSGLLSRVKQGRGLSADDKMRAFYGLAMLGFRDPGAFFIAE